MPILQENSSPREVDARTQIRTDVSFFYSQLSGIITMSDTCNPSLFLDPLYSGDPINSIRTAIVKVMFASTPDAMFRELSFGYP
jgi:hypothetical protein